MAVQKNETLLDYLRHGEPVGGNRYRGHGIDDPLSETGWRQMRETADAIHGWQAIVTSPLQRCQAFAEWLGAQRNLPVRVVDDLREVGFGSWEGMSRDELIAQRPDEYRDFHADPVHNRPANAESLSLFGSRVATAFDHLLDEFAGQHLLIVAHAGVIRATLGHVVQAPAANWYRTEVANASLTRFARNARGLRLVAHNWQRSL